MGLLESVLVFGVMFCAALLIIVACWIAWWRPELGLGVTAAAIWQAYEHRPSGCSPSMELCTPVLDHVICLSFVIAALALALTAGITIRCRYERRQLPRAELL